jgi:hypothetical protein
MRQIAEASGGSTITQEQLIELPGRAQSAERKALLREQTTSQWDKPWVFALLCSLLGLEWYFRRRSGLC